MAEDLTNYDLIVIGGSAGSLEVILKILPDLDPELQAALILVLHRKSDSDSALVELLATRSPLPVEEAAEKDPIQAGHIYVAPADYHLLIENDCSLSLDYSEKVNFSRPCIDVTFQSAAEVYGTRLACILLSGASADGTEGLRTVIRKGGRAVVQDPLTAEVDFMPRYAIRDLGIQDTVSPAELAGLINRISRQRS